jgi:uncharacterized glyoxalase superfamily protein PhnB
MKFKSITPVLYTKELKQTRTFYISKLKFNCVGEDLENGWMLLRKDDIEIMITLPNDHMHFERPVFTGSVYIRLESGIDTWWNTLSKTVTVAYPIETFDYGMKEFAIYDNNGYMIQFGQPTSED